MRRRSPISTGAVRRAPRRSPEFDEQCALIEWARIPAVVAQYPGIDLLEGSMNGVKLSKAQAGKAKAAGMLTGAHDVRLPETASTHLIVRRCYELRRRLDENEEIDRLTRQLDNIRRALDTAAEPINLPQEAA